MRRASSPSVTKNQLRRTPPRTPSPLGKSRRSRRRPAARGSRGSGRRSRVTKTVSPTSVRTAASIRPVSGRVTVNTASQPSSTRGGSVGVDRQPFAVARRVLDLDLEGELVDSDAVLRPPRRGPGRSVTRSSPPSCVRSSMADRATVLPDCVAPRGSGRSSAAGGTGGRRGAARHARRPPRWPRPRRRLSSAIGTQSPELAPRRARHPLPHRAVAVVAVVAVVAGPAARPARACAAPDERRPRVVGVSDPRGWHLQTPPLDHPARLGRCAVRAVADDGGQRLGEALLVAQAQDGEDVLVAGAASGSTAQRTASRCGSTISRPRQSIAMPGSTHTHSWAQSARSWGCTSRPQTTPQPCSSRLCRRCRSRWYSCSSVRSRAVMNRPVNQRRREVVTALRAALLPGAAPSVVCRIAPASSPLLQTRTVPTTHAAAPADRGGMSRQPRPRREPQAQPQGAAAAAAGRRQPCDRASRRRRCRRRASPARPTTGARLHEHDLVGDVGRLLRRDQPLEAAPGRSGRVRAAGAPRP